eukprot:641118-Rhodomonas_salina.1
MPVLKVVRRQLLAVILLSLCQQAAGLMYSGEQNATETVTRRNGARKVLEVPAIATELVQM